MPKKVVATSSHVQSNQTQAKAVTAAPKSMVTSGINFNSLNVGIKSALAPKKQNQSDEDSALSNLAEPFSFEELMRVWNEYALILKRDKKDKLHAILTAEKPILNSDYKISFEISNTALAIDLEKEKIGLLSHLRNSLRNGRIAFSYKVSDVKRISVVDSKSHFEKFAEENPTLHKFRKLFNLDIDF